MIAKIKNKKLFLIDLDGTTYLDNKLIDGAKRFVEKLKSNKKSFCFLTNNNSKSRKVYVKKLNKLGIKITPENIYTSGMATISYLQKNYADKKVFLLGTKALKAEFADAKIKLDLVDPEVVVVAYDTELVYKNLDMACYFIRKGLPFIATHPDINCPVVHGFAPDVGSFLSLIKTSTFRDPDIIIGKPFAPIAQSVLLKYDVKPSDIVMIGDRLTTDIQFAKNNGLTSVLVLSGETTKNLYEKSTIKADIVINSIKDLLKKENT